MRSNLETSTHDADKKVVPVSAVGFKIPAKRLINESEDELGHTQDRVISFQSKVMLEFHKLASLYARSSASVLITGESGTGKELFSRFIHSQSPRSTQAFVAVNCAAISESLMESEFFGHKKGAFTGADKERVGYFERANGGTLLLDEISELPLRLQSKLLRVIEEREVLHVGGDRPKPIDVRIVATSNRNLRKEVEQGRFRHDLFHRINVTELTIPPLRERSEDVPLLAMHFLKVFQSESPSKELSISKETMQQLCAYRWPGNVRELRNVIHRSCIVSLDQQLDTSALAQESNSPTSPNIEQFFSGMTLAEAEKRLILSCLGKFGGDKKLAADELGITTRTILNKLKQYEGTQFAHKVDNQSQKQPDQFHDYKSRET